VDFKSNRNRQRMRPVDRSRADREQQEQRDVDRDAKARETARANQIAQDYSRGVEPFEFKERAITESLGLSAADRVRALAQNAADEHAWRQHFTATHSPASHIALSTTSHSPAGTGDLVGYVQARIVAIRARDNCDTATATAKFTEEEPEKWEAYRAGVCAQNAQSEQATRAVSLKFDQLIADHLRTHGGSYADAAIAVAAANPGLAHARNRAVSMPIVGGVAMVTR
jgi:hypothetical protein